MLLANVSFQLSSASMETSFKIYEEEEVKISPLIKPDKQPKQPPVGLSGWFSLIVIGLFGTILLDIVTVVPLLPIDLSIVNMFFFVVFLISLLNEVVLSAVILILIFKRSIIFRVLFLIQTCILGACILIIQDGSSLIQMLARILWTVYLFRSERVKNTFIGIKSINQVLAETETPVS